MNIMYLQRRRENPLIICCLAVFTLVLCRSKRLTTASASTDETSKGKNNGGLHISDFFSSLYGDNVKKTHDAGALDPPQTIQLSQAQISAFLNQFQQSQNQGSHQNNYHEEYDNNRRGKSNRRKVLYGLSVRAHYEMLLHEQESNNASSSVNDESFDDVTSSSCDYYNDGMQFSFDVEKITKEKSIFSRCSHWTYRLCPKKSVSQIHLEPSALTDDDGDQILKLPPNAILSNSIQFLLPTTHDLGTYLPPWTPDYESLVSAAWGPEETKVPVNDVIEYYINGDFCAYTEESGNTIAVKRQSKVIYDAKCCNRRESMMEEFFQNDGEIMIRSTTEPEPCRYILKACKICPEDEVRANRTLEVSTEPASVDPSDFGHLLQTYLQYPPLGSETDNPVGGAFPPMPPSQIEANKKLLQSMFTHAYDSYFHNAFPASELKPLACQPGKFNLVRVPALTLIDTLDTFIIMGNYTEFARSVERLRYLDQIMKHEFKAGQGISTKGEEKREGGGLFSVNQDVSLFETTIRVLGGLLSAHQMAVAFMANLVSKSDVWDSSGDVIVGNSKAGVFSDDHIESPKRDDGDIGSAVNVAQGASVEDDGSQSCLWEPSEPNAIEVGEGNDCASEIVAANKNKKKKEKNATSSIPSPSWEYDGFLLELAHDIGKRLLLAFDSATGIPYGTVNLLHGVPPGETSVASLAGAGTLSLEFELLSRLTGDQSFGKAAKLATRALWIRRSAELNLFGKHIDAESGKWKEYLSGVGSNSDSFYEYLIKHYLLFPDDSDFWGMFLTVYSGVHENSRLGEWYVDVDMGHGLNGHVRQVFESLMAFYPGLQVLLGELVPSAKTLNSFFLVREFLGLLPERFNFAHWKTEGTGDIHPLRPELLESCYFLHLASIGLHGSKCGHCSHSSSSPHTSSWLWAADFALHAVHKLSWTPCGFATVLKVGPATTGGLDFVGDSRDPLTEQKRLHTQHHDEMPSYFLSETLKYLYLTFDAENSILHRDSERDWVFTTEAHPIHYVPVPNSTTKGDDSLEAQLDQVRLLLKESISNSGPSVDEELSAAAGVARNFEDQQWSKMTPESIFAESMHNVEREVKASKHETDGVHDFKSGPYLRRRSFSPAQMESYGIFSSEISAINVAHNQFESQGKGNGNGLGKRCPNFHHPDLQWTHALHNSLDYNAAHSSSVSNEAFNSNDGPDERMLTALASVCFYGTDYFAGGMSVDKSKSCPIEEAPDHNANLKLTSTNDNKLRPSTRTSIPGATRYDMGSELGLFDVSAFPGGDGFVVKHVDSNELLEVSIFHDNPESSTGTVILVVLTVPPPRKASELDSSIKEGASPSLFSRISGGSWTRRLSGNSANRQSSGADTEPEMEVSYNRHVVVADLEANSFQCEVVITKKRSGEADTFLSSFPCSPAFFGKANMPNLVRESGGEVVKGLLRPPPPGDEFGCKPSNDDSLFDEGDSCQVDEHLGGSTVVQLVRRGDCNFSRKASNQGAAEGIIVINSNPYELFVMAGERTQLGSNDFSDNDLPVSVLVSGQDGDSIIKLLQDEASKGNDGDVVDATILLTKASDELIEFPYVKGSKEALQILASNGWGIHAVPQAQTQQKTTDGWQLFITQHNKQ